MFISHCAEDPLVWPEPGRYNNNRSNQERDSNTIHHSGPRSLSMSYLVSGGGYLLFNWVWTGRIASTSQILDLISHQTSLIKSSLTLKG